MFWIATVLLIAFVFAFIVTFIIDPTSYLYVKVQRLDPTPIQKECEEYLNTLGVKIDKKICYRYVEYRHDDKDTVIVGTFHEWNGTYYIDISTYLFVLPSEFCETVQHETRHMLVRELKNKKIIDLSKYTEDIAQNDNENFNNLFKSSINLLKEKK